MAGRSAIVVGASFAGLLAAAALAGAGLDVIIVERDEVGDDPSPRRGVPQGPQVHVVLDQGWRSAEAVLPGLRSDVSGHGAARFDSGRMPWLGEFGWQANDQPGYPMTSVTRPLLESIVRRRVLALAGVTARWDHTVRGLSRSGDRWQIETATSGFAADVVVDATGRASRLPIWLGELGVPVPEPEIVDARLGYATRAYSAPVPLPVRTGIVIMGSVTTGTGGLAMPVEHGRWLLMAGGYGEHRPPRDPAGFEAFLAGLRDPVLGRLAERLEPVTDVAVHRQTGNRRHRFESVTGFPPGLLAVGDAAVAFNPIYGQGISVAAGQAELLGRALKVGAAVDHRLQRRLSAVADLPWTIATGADRRMPDLALDGGPAARLLAAWSDRTARLMAAGDPVATAALGLIYNLRAPLSFLFHPLLIGSVLRSAVRPQPSLPRPAVLDRLESVAPLRRLLVAEGVA